MNPAAVAARHDHRRRAPRAVQTDRLLMSADGDRVGGLVEADLPVRLLCSGGARGDAHHEQRRGDAPNHRLHVASHASASLNARLNASLPPENRWFRASTAKNRRWAVSSPNSIRARAALK